MKILFAWKHNINTNIGVRYVSFNNHIVERIKKGIGFLSHPPINNLIYLYSN